MQETVLSVIPGNDQDHRLLVVLVPGDGRDTIELQQQSWSGSVGWFTQSRLPIEREQLAMLRGALGINFPKRSSRPAADSLETIPFPGNSTAHRDSSAEIA